MPVDAGIPLQYKGLQLDNPLTNYAQYQQILAAKSQNKLADLTMGQKQAEIDRAAAEDRAYAAAGDPRDPAYRANLEAALVNEGQGRNIPKLRQDFAAQDATDLELQKLHVDTALAHAGYISQALSGATPQNYETVRKNIASLNQKAAANLPPVYDAAAIDGLMKSGIPMVEQMKNKRDELDRLWKEKNAQLNREVTMRGQDKLSDDRRAALEPDGPNRENLDYEIKLSDRYSRESAAFREVRQAKDNVTNSLAENSAAGDLAAATSLMKLLDPASVVRESELALAMNATGSLDRAGNYAQMVINGQRLNSAQRKEMLSLAEQLFNTAESYNKQTKKRYKDMAKKYELDPYLITGETWMPGEITEPGSNINGSSVDDWSYVGTKD